MRMQVLRSLSALALAASSAAALAAQPARVARTIAALDDLDRVCQEAEKRGQATLYSRIPLLVERQALLALDADNPHRDHILDLVYESALRAKVAMLEGHEARRPEVPPPPDLARVKLQNAFWVEGDRVVFPVVADQCPIAAKAFFAGGELVRSVPALAGATEETLEETELVRLYNDEPASRRVGWDRPAGGFVRDGALICLDHKGTCDAIAAETAKAIAAWPAEPRPLYVSIGADPFYTDYSDASRARFAAWVRDHYKTLRTLNLVWNTEFKDYTPDLLPTPDQAIASPSRWVDFALFNAERLTGHARWAAGNVRRAAPSLPVGLAPFRYAFAGSYALSGADPLALAEQCDVLEINGLSTMHADLAFALARGRRPVVDAAYDPALGGIIPRQLHGCAAVRVAAWPSGPLTSVEAIRRSEQLLRDALDARRVAPECAALAQAPRQVALLYSQASLRLAPHWALRAAQTPYTRELAKAYEAARFLDVGVTFLTSRDVAEVQWQGVRVLIVPAASAEEENVVRNLADFIELGGHVVLIAESFVHDDRGRQSDYLERLGIEVPETRHPQWSTKPRPDLGGALDDLVMADAPANELKPAPDGPLARVTRPLRAVGVTQKLKVNVAHAVLATFADGSPAIATYARGKGSLTYLAAPLEAEDLAVVLRIVLAKAGVEAAVRHVHLGDNRPWGVECRSVRDGSRILAYAWNTTEQPLRIALEAPPVAAALDLATGRPLATQTDKSGSLLGPLSLGPGEVAILQLTLPKPKSP